MRFSIGCCFVELYMSSLLYRIAYKSRICFIVWYQRVRGLNGIGVREVHMPVVYERRRCYWQLIFAGFLGSCVQGVCWFDGFAAGGRVQSQLKGA